MGKSILNNKNNKKLQKFFINYRIKNHLTQEELGDKLKMSKSYVSKIERGCRVPSHNNFIKKLKKIGVDNAQAIRLVK